MSSRRGPGSLGSCRLQQAGQRRGQQASRFAAFCGGAAARRAAPPSAHAARGCRAHKRAASPCARSSFPQGADQALRSRHQPRVSSCVWAAPGCRPRRGVVVGAAQGRGGRVAAAAAARRRCPIQAEARRNEGSCFAALCVRLWWPHCRGQASCLGPFAASLRFGCTSRGTALAHALLPTHAFRGPTSLTHTHTHTRASAHDRRVRPPSLTRRPAGRLRHLCPSRLWLLLSYARSH